MQSFKSIFFRVAFVAAAFAPAVLMAQEVAISGKDFESGAGDAKLAEIARQAAASGKTVVITAPPYWQGQAAAKLHAGASNVQVKTTDAFFETVLVRIVGPDKPAEKTEKQEKAEKVAKAPEPVAKPEPAPKRVETPPAVAKTAPRAEPKPAPPVVTPIAEKPQAVEKQQALAPAPVAAPAPTPAAVAPPVAVSSAPAAPVVTAPAPAAVAASVASHSEIGVPEQRKKFEEQLNLGRAAEGTLNTSQLQKNDEIFVRGPVRAVVRRFGARLQLFWLTGALNLDRTELTQTEVNHYKVNEAIRETATPAVRAMHNKPLMLTAAVPAEKTTLRTDMERHFNDAKPILSQLRTDELQYGDFFYVYRTYAVVFRRTDMGFNRYWLEGEIDLNQAGLVRDGDAYRLVSDRL